MKEPYVTINTSYEALDVLEGKHLYMIRYKDFIYPIYLHLKRHDNLHIGGIGALLKKEQVGTVQIDRWSWSDAFNGSLIVVSDPIISSPIAKGKDIWIGWYYKHIPNIVVILEKIISQIKPKYIINSGSSAAGFFVLQLAQYMQSTITVAWNPQVNFLLYEPNSNIPKLLKLFHPEVLEHELKKYAFENHKSDVFLSKGFKDYQGKIFYVQNTEDKRHFNLQFELFLRTFGTCEYDRKTNHFEQKIEIIVYKDTEFDHAPPPQAMWFKVLDYCLEKALLEKSLKL